MPGGACIEQLLQIREPHLAASYVHESYIASHKEHMSRLVEGGAMIEAPAQALLEWEPQHFRAQRHIEVLAGLAVPVA